PDRGTEVAREEFLFLEGGVVEGGNGMAVRVPAFDRDLDAFNEALENEGRVLDVFPLGLVALVLDEGDHLLDVFAHECLDGAEVATGLVDPLVGMIGDELDGAVEVDVLEHLGVGNGQAEGAERVETGNTVQFQQVQSTSTTQNRDTKIMESIGNAAASYHVE